jgi:hypothetical protein
MIIFCLLWSLKLTWYIVDCNANMSWIFMIQNYLSYIL